MNSSLFREEALRFANQQTLGSVIVVQPLETKILTMLVLAIVVISFGFLLLGDYSRKETVSGYLDPDSGIVNLYPKDRGALVRKVLVKNGEWVEANQIVIETSYDKITTNGKDMFVDLRNTIEEQKRQLVVQLFRHEEYFDLEEKQLRSRISEINREIDNQVEFLKHQNQRLALADELIEAIRPLQEARSIPKAQWLGTLSDKYEKEKEIVLINNRIFELKNEITHINHELAQLPKRQANELLKTELQLATIEQKLTELHGRQNTFVTAPLAGRVSALQAKAGTTTDVNLPLLSILPDGLTLECVLLIPSTSIGFINVGQEIRIKFDAFPHQQFGTQPAKLVSLSESPILAHELDGLITTNGPVYIAKAKLLNDSISVRGQTKMFQPGMLLKADVILERRTLFEWLLEPLLAFRGNSE